MLVMDSHDFFDGIRGFDSMVVWYDRGVVVEHMRRDDVVKEILFNEANVSVDGASSSADESPHLWIVVRQATVGVMKICDCYCV